VTLWICPPLATRNPIDLESGKRKNPISKITGGDAEAERRRYMHFYLSFQIKLSYPLF